MEAATENTVESPDLKRKAPEQEEGQEQQQQEEAGSTPKKLKVDEAGGEKEKEKEQETAGGGTTTQQEREWYYIDDEKKEQGPFTLSEMQSWWFGGYMPTTLTVRKKDEKEFVPITNFPEFQQQTQQPAFDPSAYYAYYYQAMAASTTDPAAAAAAATASASTTATPQMSYSMDQQQVYPGYMFQPPVDKSEDDRIAAKLLCSDYAQSAAFNKRTGRFSSLDSGYTDSAERQMAHYFDFDNWQRQCQDAASKKVKRVCPRHMWKQYRKKKKIPDYLKD